jgi:hypothetical protein
MRPTTAVFYGDASGAALVDAIKRWRNEYAPQHAYEGLVGGPVRSCKVQATLWRVEKFSVHVRIEGSRWHTDEDYWYEATLVAGELRLESIVE